MYLNVSWLGNIDFDWVVLVFKIVLFLEGE